MSHDTDIEKEDLIQWMEDLIQQLRNENTECPSFSWIRGDDYESESGHLCVDFDIQIKIVNPKANSKAL